MTGKELYALYVAAMDKNGILIDEWDDLYDRDRVAWDDVATALAEQPEEARS